MEQRDFCFEVEKTNAEYIPPLAVAGAWLLNDRSLVGLAIAAVLAALGYYFARRWVDRAIEQRRLHLGQSFLSYHLGDHILWHIPYADITSFTTTHAGTILVVNKNGSCFTQTNIEELPESEQFIAALEQQVEKAVPHLVAS